MWYQSWCHQLGCHFTLVLSIVNGLLVTCILENSISYIQGGPNTIRKSTDDCKIFDATLTIGTSAM